MRRWISFALCAFAALASVACSSLAVKTPSGMSFISTGDFIPGVRTLGLVQAKETAIMPLLISDQNKIKQALYEQLLQKAKDAGGTGLTNISFYWMPSAWSIASWYILTVVIDFYAEGFVIVEE